MFAQKLFLCLFQGQPVVHSDIANANYYCGKYGYPQPGYAWAWVRAALDRIGGLFELGGMGSGDYHMVLAFDSKANRSLASRSSSNPFMFGSGALYER